MRTLVLVHAAAEGVADDCHESEGQVRVALFVSVMFAFFMAPAAAEARVAVTIDLSSQRMDVYVNGRLRHEWAVSTGRRGYRTPTGTWRPKRLERMWYSRKYYNSPMPHSIFFHGGYAIHGTDETRRLGRPASHGCVRLSRGNAARLFRLVSQYGPKRVLIAIRP